MTTYNTINDVPQIAEGLNNLEIKQMNGINVMDSRDVAKWIGQDHSEVIYSIEGNKKRRIVGIIPTLKGNGTFTVSDFFIEGEYFSRGKTFKMYWITKKGCELLGNKLQGTKGILFSAKFEKNKGD